MNQAIRIIQLTDLHLFSDQKTKLIGLNPYRSLQQVIAKLANNSTKQSPSLIVVTGDISQDYSLASYENAITTLRALSYPIMATMGNHDRPEIFTEIFADPTQDTNKIFNLNNWCILCLNSHLHEHVSGELANKELEFLHRTLPELNKQHVMIFLHHHVLPVGSAWLDRIMLNNANQLLEIIDHHKNIKAVVCGHVHQETATMHSGVSFLSTTATSWQFTIKSKDFKLDPLMPGYRWIDLYEEGIFQTEVVRIEHEDTFIPDLTSKGY